MFCKNCGNALDEGAAFCSKCGTSTQETAAPAAAPVESAAPVKKKKKWLIPAVAAAVVVVLAAVLFGGGSKLSKEVKPLVGEWPLYGAIIDGDMTYNFNGKMIVDKDGTVTVTVGDTTENFDRIEYEQTLDGRMVYRVYKGSDYVKAIYGTEPDNSTTVMLALASNFVLVFRR